MKNTLYAAFAVSLCALALTACKEKTAEAPMDQAPVEQVQEPAPEPAPAAEPAPEPAPAPAPAEPAPEAAPAPAEHAPEAGSAEKAPEAH